MLARLCLCCKVFTFHTVLICSQLFCGMTAMFPMSTSVSPFPPQNQDTSTCIQKGSEPWKAEIALLLQVMRNRKQIFEGELASLRRVKENVTEMTQGNECGVGVVNFIDWREGDKINAVEVQFKRQTLEEASERELTSNLQSLDEEELELEVGRRR